LMEKYSAEWPLGLSDVEIELGMIRHGGQSDIYPEALPLFEHYMNARKLIWTKRYRHRWTDAMYREFIQNDITILLGAACIAGNTRILNPITGEKPTIDYLFQHQIAPTVMTLTGPRQASVPFVKGVAQLFEITLASGNKFTATAAHRLLTSSGYVPVRQLSFGDRIYAYTPCLPVSSSDIAPSIHGRGEADSLKTTEGFLFHCSVDFRPGDEQLPPATGIFRWLFPLPIGARKRMERVFCNEDGLEHEPKRSRPCEPICHPSSCNAFLFWMRLETLSLLRSLSESVSQLLLWFQSVWQWTRDCAHLRTFPKQVSCADYRQPFFGAQFLETPRHSSSGRCERQVSGFQKPLRLRSSPGPACKERAFSGFERHGDSNNELSYTFRVSQERIVSICKAKQDVYYDLTVPGPGHYFAEGAIHHNSSQKTSHAAEFALLNYWARPFNTLVILSTISVDKLETGIFGEVKMLWHSGRQLYPRLAGHLLEGKHAISTDNLQEGQVRDLRRGIIGRPMYVGKKWVGLGILAGTKQDYIFFVADELQWCAETFIPSWPNLFSNGQVKIIGSGNPKHDPDDQLGIAAEPKMGWSSMGVPQKTEAWDTQFLNGR